MIHLTTMFSVSSKFSLSATILLFGLAPPSLLVAQQPAPIEGYGAATKGALSAPNHTVYHVTSLDDDGGKGTLRDAVSQSNRRIVFDIGGSIVLKTKLKIAQDFLTIDGFSAPSPGITITHKTGAFHGVLIDGQRRHTHDVIIQGIRFRGLYDKVPTSKVGDYLLSIDGDCRSQNCEGGVSKVVFDRISVCYDRDKLSIWGKVSDVTISNSLFFGSHKALLISFYSKPYDLIKQRISIHHNLFYGNQERNPQLVSWITDLDFRNNIIYGWGKHGYGMRIKSVNVGNRGKHSVDANIINNLFFDTKGNSGSAIIYQRDRTSICHPQGTLVPNSGMGRLWVAGNLLPGRNCDQYSTAPQELAVPDHAKVQTHKASQLCDVITPRVGAPFPNPEEQRLISDVRKNLESKKGAKPPQAPRGTRRN